MNMMKYILLIAAVLSLSACQSDASKRLDDDANKRALLHYRLGLDALHKGTVPKAFEELFISDKLRPNQPDTLDAIAYAWRLRGDNRQAEKYYKLAIKHNAGSATLNNYGGLLVEIGKYDQAIKQLNKCLEDPRYPNQALAYISLGDAYIGLKNLEKAVASYRKANLLSSGWTYPKLKEAQAYAAFNRPNYAQALYETLLRKHPDHQQALAGLIKLLKNKGKESLVRKYINSFIQETKNELQKAWAKDELALLRARK